MFILRTPLFLLSEADGNPSGGGGDKTQKPVDPAAALAQIEDPTLPMKQRLTVAADAIRGIPPTAQFAKVQAELDTTKATLATRDAELKQANARIAALEADAKENEATISTLGQENKDLKAKEQDLEKRVEARVKEKMGSLGFPESKLPAADDKVAATGGYEEALAEYSKITDPHKRAAYYQSHVLPFLSAKK